MAMLNKLLDFRDFRFFHAVIISILIHFLFLFVPLIFKEDVPDDSFVEPKYVKVKIGRINFEDSKKAHNKPVSPIIPKLTQDIKKEVVEKKIIKPIVKKVARNNVPKQKKVVKAKKVIPLIKPSIKQNRDKPDVKNVDVKKHKDELRHFKQSLVGVGDKSRIAKVGVKGDEVGNRAKARKLVVDNYRQRIKLHLEKNKVFPDEAIKRNLSAITKMRIKFNRHGKLLNYGLLETTGYKILDMAVLEMIKRSDPFPPFPKEYPDKDITVLDLVAKFTPPQNNLVDRAMGLFP